MARLSLPTMAALCAFVGCGPTVLIDDSASVSAGSSSGSISQGNPSGSPATTSYSTSSNPGTPSTTVGSGPDDTSSAPVGYSGIDTCDQGAMCWNVDENTLEGTCSAFCVGSEANPSCADPNTICTFGAVDLCLPLCNPILQDCPVGQGCYPFDSQFICAPAAERAGSDGDGCQYLNDCQPALACVDSGALANCDGPACCTEICALSLDDCPDPTESCLPAFEDVFPQYDVGFCMVP